MKRRIDPGKLQWITKPELYITNSDRILIETEPFSELIPAGSSAEAIELSLSPKGSFCFTIRTEYEYRRPFDQCGITVYAQNERIAVAGTEYRDREMQCLKCIVFHDGRGDQSGRDISSGIRKMYYRIWYRAGALRIQYSFTGSRYSDLREFWAGTEKKISIGIYACSPGDSWFDCTFCEMMLDEEDQKEGSL
ncbi:MAG: DUF1349 domain-containing protein [Solobacterium sp.]|nr:DUF1349 domain-containing protein [Solobacterium sp.]